MSVSAIRRAERGVTIPTRETACKLAHALHIRLDLLLTGDGGVMLPPVHMTVAAQMRFMPPEALGHPDTVLIVGPRPWYRDRHGKWRVERQF